MVIYLKPYHADASLVRRVYPVVPFHDIVAARAQHANMAMHRAYAATKSTKQDPSFGGVPDCSTAADCSCCNVPGEGGPDAPAYKGPDGMIMGTPCSAAKAEYEKKFGKCSTTPTPLQGRGSTLQAQKKTVEDIGKGKPGKKGQSGKEQQHAKTRVSGAGTSHTKTKTAEDTGTDTSTDTSGTDSGTVPEAPAAGGVPQDLFASIPQVSQFFNSMYTKVCSSGTKIPFICTSLAYFEIAVIVVVILLVVMLTGGKRRRR